MAASSSLGLILWNPYSGFAAVLLTLILLAAGAGLILLGARSDSAVRLPTPGKALRVVILLVWALSILLVLPLFRQIAQDTGQSSLFIGPVFPITLATAFCSFFAIAYFTRASGMLAAIGSGLAGAAAGPMVFELPFVLIITPVVTTRVPHPVFLFSVFLVAILTTLALPTFSSRFSVTRYSLYFMGAMFLAFAAWALLDGYAPPSDPASFSLNAASKVLGFAAVVASFSGGLERAKKPTQSQIAEGQAL